MKSIRWLPHARKKAASREVTTNDVEKTVTAPDAVLPGRPPRQIFMRRYWDEVLRMEMLLRVIVEETADEYVIVTLYKTSKFKKYEEGSRP